jgi:hypothetical protein
MGSDDTLIIPLPQTGEIGGVEAHSSFCYKLHCLTIWSGAIFPPSYRPASKMGKFSIPKFDSKKYGLSPLVYYDQFNPSVQGAAGSRKSLTHLDYSPLRRVTWPSIVMGIVVSMGGFLSVPNERSVAVRSG